MYVTFTPTGDNANTAILTPAPGVALGAVTPPVIGTQTTIGGGTLTGYYTVTSGNPGVVLGSAGRNQLVWANSDGLILKRWTLNASANIATALEGIGDQIAAGTPAVDVSAAGVVTVAS